MIDVQKFIYVNLSTAGAGGVAEQRFTVPESINGNGQSIAAGGSVQATIKSNAGNLTVMNDGDMASFSGGAGAPTLAKIIPVSAGGVPHPAWGRSASLSAQPGGIVDASANWSFRYANDQVLEPGVYSKRVKYTVTSL